MEAVSAHRIAKALQNRLLRLRLGKILRMFGVGSFAYQYLSGAGFALQTGGEIHRVADGGVVLTIVGAEPADARVSGRNADRSLQLEAVARPEAFQSGA